MGLPAKDEKFERGHHEDNDDEISICANCGIEFESSDYARLAWCIMKHKPACSLECNIALGYVEKKNEHTLAQA